MSDQLLWMTTDYGPIPACVDCMLLLTNPSFVEAVYTAAIEHDGVDPYSLAIGCIDDFHTDGHRLDIDTTETNNPNTPQNSG